MGQHVITTIQDSLYWSYANLAMAHAAVSNHEVSYGKAHFVIRSRLFAGLQNGTMNLGSIGDDERLKMIQDRVCSYCGSSQHLTVDHLIPRIKGGVDRGENLVLACLSCNSSKNAMDLLDWYSKKEVFPPLLLLRRYLKLAIEISIEAGVMAVNLDAAPDLPFSLARIPHSFPAPQYLRL